VIEWILSLIGQFVLAVGLMGLFISMFSSNYRRKLPLFVGLIVAGGVLVFTFGMVTAI
jgi:hypothetical protein